MTIPTDTRPADRSISRITYENIWRNEYPNLTPVDRLSLARSILRDLDRMDIPEGEFVNKKLTSDLAGQAGMLLEEAG